MTVHVDADLVYCTACGESLFCPGKVLVEGASMKTIYDHWTLRHNRWTWSFDTEWVPPGEVTHLRDEVSLSNEVSR